MHPLTATVAAVSALGYVALTTAFRSGRMAPVDVECPCPRNQGQIGFGAGGTFTYTPATNDGTDGDCKPDECEVHQSLCLWNGSLQWANPGPQIGSLTYVDAGGNAVSVRVGPGGVGTLVINLNVACAGSIEFLGIRNATPPVWDTFTFNCSDCTVVP